MTTRERIFNVLAEGPATCAEIGVELEIESHLISAHMADLLKNDKITARPFHSGQAHRDVVKLYSLKEYA